MSRYRMWIPAVAGGMLMLPDMGNTQTIYGQPDYASAPPAVSSYQPAPVQPGYSQEQIEQMLAPIALYPDPLLGQILMASTYPIQVVEASRWLQDPANADLGGDQLVAALAQQPWDASVKSLVAFPQVMQMMDANLPWTQTLGNAFVAQQPALMDSVQRLRRQALAAGTLASTPQQSVQDQNGVIIIAPASADTVYVPYYNPAMAYGAWPYPDAEPYYFPPPAGYDYDEGLIGFGIGYGVIGPLWGWNQWDWHDHHIIVNNQRFNRGNANGSNGTPRPAGPWQHTPYPNGPFYRNAAPNTGTIAPASSIGQNRNYRGYEPVAQPARTTEPAPPARSFTPASEPSPSGLTTHSGFVGNAASISGPVPAPVERMAAPAMQRSTPPVFESFSPRSDIQAQAARGMASRSSAGPGIRSTGEGNENGQR